MPGARICRAALSRLSEPRKPLTASTVLMNRAQLRGQTVPASTDAKSWQYDGEPGNALSAILQSSHSEQQAKEPPIRSQIYDDVIPSRQAKASSLPGGPQSSQAQTLKTDGSSDESQPTGHHPRPLQNERPRPSTSAVIRTFKESSHVIPGRLSPEAWQRSRIRQSLYKQWGFIRHQHPPSEVLPARRAFKSWKIKLSHVLDPVDPSSWSWLEHGRWLFELNTVAAMRKAWESRDQATRRQAWPLVMLSTMHLCPDKASMVLDATLDPVLPGYAIHDVLLFVVHRFRLEASLTIREQTIKADEMLDLASKVVEDMPPSHIPFGQRTFGLLARKLPCEQVDELYTILWRNGCRLHANTLLQFASKFAHDVAHKASAYDILEMLADDGMDLNDERPASVITSLLHCQTPQNGDEHQSRPFSPTEALQSLVEKGLSPNAINATAFLDSLCQQSDVEEAIRLALLFAECGTQLDTKTWVTVFRGAKNSLKVANVVKALDVAKAANAPYVDVLNNLLHTIFCFADAESRERQRPPPWTMPLLWEPMLDVYAKKFNIEPLQWWLPDLLPAALAQNSHCQHPGARGGHGQAWAFPHSVVPVVNEFFSSGAQSRMQPNMTTIAIMLRSYLKSMRSPHDLVSFYDFFKSRLEEQGERGRLARELIKNQGSLIHDAFILAMTEHRPLARQALRVFGDMLKDHLKTGPDNGHRARVEYAKDVTAPVHPCPSVLTFTIILRGLMTHGKHVLADEVVMVMDELGVRANLVTWNTLVKGHASLQNVERTVATLQAMEAAGFHSDTFTFRAFAKLGNQSKALKMLESILDENQRKMMAEGPEPFTMEEYT
ncbi:pentatricopeptide repeat protein [Ophiocordyceps sinensis CO18]|uniref:Pentatricopeptide repeat protein n=1 Tax=Ophiocordyceps sinensis (strain Co18 / CGMCC 3.14243) TaxID=911162 RepID=T5AMD8_OPHSC|nr:pentatricopeptide repeat protein [Ophiocordyceps sinensis CO18]